jgi:hypothetical protein
MLTMLNILVASAYVALVAYVTVGAFRFPEGVYGRGLLALVGAAGSALAIWLLAGSTITAQAGVDAVFVFGGVLAIVVFVVGSACIAASLRHLLNALASRDAEMQPTLRTA